MKKVLMVEDDVSTAELIRTLLVAGGYDVLHAEEGPKALALAREENPDIILCDVMLPGMDGYTVQTKLLEDERTQHIPMIMMTVKSNLEDVFRMGANVRGFIAKPFDIAELQKKISSILKDKDG